MFKKTPIYMCLTTVCYFLAVMNSFVVKVSSFWCCCPLYEINMYQEVRNLSVEVRLEQIAMTATVIFLHYLPHVYVDCIHTYIGGL